LTQPTPFEQIIIGHEGTEKSAYRDSLGYLTIGHGRLIDSRKNAGLSPDEMLYLLRNDLAQAERELLPFDWYKLLDPVRQDVLVEMCFNMGLDGLLEFKHMIAKLTAKDYAGASQDFLCSLDAKQIGPTRAQNMAKRLATGSYE
jgi:lysozyme